MAVVEVKSACICASDLAEYRDGPHAIPVGKPHPLTGRSAPVTLGHEYSGVVVAIGEEVVSVAIGDRVCGDACIRCGTCYWCLRGEYNICRTGASIGLHADGAFCSRLEAPAYTLVKVPAEVADATAALTEPLAVGLHAARQGGISAGDTVVVAGLGMIGAASLMMARRCGAASVLVIEPNPHRRGLALEIGASDALDPTGLELVREVRARTSGIGADVVIDCTGRQELFPMFLDCARRGGRVVVAGIGYGHAALDLNRVVHFERQITGALGYRFDHASVLRMLADGLLPTDRLITSPIPLRMIVELGFERMLRDPSAPIRIFVDPR
jgi:(R,R)-butanediol dehydrogenase/meso-butanediol dehydrogenase/diacetyl reductase